MMNDDDFEKRLKKLISDTQDEINKVDDEIELLGDKQSDLVEELYSYETSLKNYLKRTGAEIEDGQPVWEELLKNCNTHKQRLLCIAEQNSGELRFNDAVNIIYNGHYITSKSRSNAYVQLYQIIEEMVGKGEMEKIKRGIYKITQRGRLI